MSLSLSYDHKQGSKDEDDGPSDGYSAGAKVSVEELLAKDSEDESLRRYKEQLLGAAAQGHTAVDPNDKRRVVITELKIIFEDRPKGDVTYTLNTPVRSHTSVSVLREYIWQN